MSAPLTCYLHVAQVGRWEAIARELIERMDAAGLTGRISYPTVCFSGPAAVPGWLQKRAHIIHNGDVIPAGEVPTLRTLHTYCREDPTGHVLYLHVKGASHPPGAVDRWRDFLAAGVIGRWRECVERLDSGEYDAAGNEWYGPGMDDQWREAWGLHGLDFLPHFAGNMWWGRADYIAKLDPPPLCVRHDAEYRFVGVGNPRVWCPAFMGVNWYTGGPPQSNSAAHVSIAAPSRGQ